MNRDKIKERFAETYKKSGYRGPRGPAELVGQALFAVAGLYLGYQFGNEAVEYVNTLSENKDVIGHMIEQYPNLATIVSALAGGKLASYFGKYVGSPIDVILDTKAEI